MLTVLAWRSLRRQPARAVVTVLGILAGVAGLRALELGTAGAFASVRSFWSSSGTSLTLMPALRAGGSSKPT